MARKGTWVTGRVAARSEQVAGDLRVTQVHPDAGSATQRREMDFGCVEKILGGCDAAVALSDGSHALWHHGRLRRMVVMV